MKKEFTKTTFEDVQTAIIEQGQEAIEVKGDKLIVSIAVDIDGREDVYEVVIKNDPIYENRDGTVNALVYGTTDFRNAVAELVGHINEALATYYKLQ